MLESRLHPLGRPAGKLSSRSSNVLMLITSVCANLTALALFLSQKVESNCRPLGGLVSLGNRRRAGGRKATQKGPVLHVLARESRREKVRGDTSRKVGWLKETLRAS